MVRMLYKLLYLILHLLFIGVILISFYPMAKWYFTSKPLWGVDFYYTATLVILIKNNFTFPHSGWNYACSAGWPLLLTYPILHYYLILPLSMIFDLVVSIKIWMLASLGLYFIGLYAVYFFLSK